MSTSPRYSKFDESKWYDWLIWMVMVMMAMFSSCPWMLEAL